MAKILNITPFFSSSILFVASSAPAPVIVIVSLTSMYASLQSHKLDLKLTLIIFYLSSGDIYLSLGISLGI